MLVLSLALPAIASIFLRKFIRMKEAESERGIVVWHRSLPCTVRVITLGIRKKPVGANECYTSLTILSITMGILRVWVAVVALKVAQLIWIYGRPLMGSTKQNWWWTNGTESLYPCLLYTSDAADEEDSVDL